MLRIIDIFKFYELDEIDTWGNKQNGIRDIIDVIEI
jgi:hypothetical protein